MVSTKRFFKNHLLFLASKRETETRQVLGIHRRVTLHKPLSLSPQSLLTRKPDFLGEAVRLTSRGPCYKQFETAHNDLLNVSVFNDIHAPLRHLKKVATSTRLTAFHDEFLDSLGDLQHRPGVMESLGTASVRCRDSAGQVLVHGAGDGWTLGGAGNAASRLQRRDRNSW